MISEEDAAKHLSLLISTDKQFGMAKAYVDSMDEQRKCVEAAQFIEASGSAAERKQKALSSTLYLEHIKRLEDARYTMEILRARRLTAITAIDMWRSINSSMKKGNII